MPAVANNEAEVYNNALRSHTGAWFESKHCKIYGKDRKAGLVTPRQNRLQRLIQDVLDEMNALELPERVIILKPRQKGSTTYGSALVYTMLRRTSTSAVVIGGQVSQVQEAWSMLQTYQKNDTLDWKNTGEINSKSGSWTHGSKLIQETAGDARAGIGGTHQALHCFETARWKELGVANSSEVLTNIMKCVPLLPGTLINLESTAEGQTGAFYTYWLSGMDADAFLANPESLPKGGFVRCFAAWFEFEDSAMRLDPEEKRQVEASLDEEPWYFGERELIEAYGTTGDDGVLRLGEHVTEYDVWEQLAWRRWAIENECSKELDKFERDYPKSWRTAFQKSGSQRFNQNGLAKLRARAPMVRPIYGIIEENKGRPVFRQTEKGEAKVIMYEKPISGARYILAVDPMTGDTQVGGKDPDRHGVFVLRAGFWDSQGKWRPMAVVARVIQCRWDIDVLEKAVWSLARQYGGQTGCKIVIEMNQDKGLTELLKKRGADLYQREIFNQREQRTTRALGFQTNEKTRENLVEKMAEVIREWDKPGSGIEIWDTDVLDQCDNFVRKDNGRSEHAEGWHDDDVFGVALGVTLIEHATTYVPQANIFNIPVDLRGGSGQQRMPSQFS